MLMELFNSTGPAKAIAMLPHVDAFVSDRYSGKLLIFGHHKATLDTLAEHISRRGVDFIRIDGRTPLTARHKLVKKFQTVPSCRVAILSIATAGIALTLTAASTVYFAELFWTPAALIQAEDRAHRIGQTSQLNIHYYLCPNSIDNIIWPMVLSKMKLLGELFEGSATSMEVENSSISMSALEALQDSGNDMIEITETVK